MPCARCGVRYGEASEVAVVTPDRIFDWACWLALSATEKRIELLRKEVEGHIAAARPSKPLSLRAIPIGSPGLGKRA